MAIETQQQTIVVNGEVREICGDLSRSLLGVLRDELSLTGTKYGCGEAMCGACVVLMNGRPTPACITPVGDACDAKVVTIEGLANGDRLHPVQSAFLTADALQCGYCTPGMILEVVALLERNSAPTDAETVDALSKHICRCGAYGRILSAVQIAAENIRSEHAKP